MVKIDTLFNNGIRWWRFWRRKMGYAGKAVAIILFMSRAELRERWIQGRQEHGTMTDEEFMAFDAQKNLKEELLDGYWYHMWEEEQKR